MAYNNRTDGRTNIVQQHTTLLSLHAIDTRGPAVAEGPRVSGTIHWRLSVWIICFFAVALIAFSWWQLWRVLLLFCSTCPRLWSRRSIISLCTVDSLTPTSWILIYFAAAIIAPDQSSLDLSASVNVHIPNHHPRIHRMSSVSSHVRNLSPSNSRVQTIKPPRHVVETGL